MSGVFLCQRHKKDIPLYDDFISLQCNDRKTYIKLYQKMKATNNPMNLSRGFVYEAPELEIVDVAIERGFEASFEASFDGPSYDEEDVEW